MRMVMKECGSESEWEMWHSRKINFQLSNDNINNVKLNKFAVRYREMMGPESGGKGAENE